MKTRGIKRMPWIFGIVLLGCLVVFFSMAFAPMNSEAAPAKMRLMCASGGMTSGFFPAHVSMAKMVNAKVPEVNISLVETGGAYECIARAGKDVEMYTNTSYPASLARYNGLGRFQGKAYKDLRTIYKFARIPYLFMVRADSGVKTLKDLQGKKYFLGPVGSQAGTVGKTVLDALGIKIDQVWGSLSDSITMTQDRRIAGFHKACPWGEIDATMWEVKSYTPIRILSLTKEEAAIVGKLVPGMSVHEFPAGSIRGFEDQVPTYAMIEYTGGGVTKSLPEPIAYKIARALNENWHEIAKNYITYYNLPDVVEGTIQGTSDITGVEPVPLHAGVVRYFTELGKKIPASIIPPEYKK